MATGYERGGDLLAKGGLFPKERNSQAALPLALDVAI